MTPVEACPVCSGPSDGAEAFLVREDDQLLECPLCGLIYSDKHRNDVELQELYSRHYYSVENTLEGSERDRERDRNRVLYRTVISDLLWRYPELSGAGRGAPPKVLDYGCGPGYFLAECRDHGFECTGIELSDVAAQYARERLGLEIRTSPKIALAALPDGEFSLVTAWAVLEHAQSPRDLLAGLARVTASGGVLCLSVPNLRCWRRLVEGGRWFNMRNPTHLSFFRRKGLERLLHELGLESVSCPLFWGGRPGFGAAANLVQYGVRLLGLGSDLRLYARKTD